MDVPSTVCVPNLGSATEQQPVHAFGMVKIYADLLYLVLAAFFIELSRMQTTFAKGKTQ